MAINSKSQTVVEGLDELIKAFAALGDEAMPKLKAAADGAGEIVLQKAKTKVPVKPGHLRDKLKLGKMKTKVGKYLYYTKITFSGAEYGGSA